MASYVDNNSKLDWALMFQRTGKFPIDRSSMFSSYADAVKYAAGNSSDPDSRGLQGSSYVGQIITVYENDTVNVYKIDADRSLSPIGSGGGSYYDVTIESISSSSLGNTVNFSSDSIPILENQPGFLNILSNDPIEVGSYNIFPLLFYKEDFIVEGSASTLTLNKLVYKSMPLLAYEEGDGEHGESLMISLTFDLTNENPYSSATINFSYPLGTNTVFVTNYTRDSLNTYYNFSSESLNVLSQRPAFLSLEYSSRFEVAATTFYYKYQEDEDTLVYKSLPYGRLTSYKYIKTLTFDLTSENPYSVAIVEEEEYHEGSTVIANPTLVGTEDNLTGLEVDGTKYKIPQGGGSGTGNYPDLTNLPSINNVTLVGNKTSADLSLASSSDITSINSKIPSQASSINQLADKDFVNSSVSTATATFRGTFTSLNTLQATDGDRNDYAFYSHQDSSGNTVYDRYKYVGLPESRVPSGYTQLYSIGRSQTGNTSSSYIDTAIVLKQGYRIYSKMTLSSQSGYTNRSYFGVKDSSNNEFRLNKNGTNLLRMVSSLGNTNNTSVSNGEHIIEVKNGNFYVDDSFVGAVTIPDFSDDFSLYLFAYNNNGTAASDGATALAFCEFKIWDNNDNLILDLVPCLNDEDKPGMYDVVSQMFLSDVNYAFNTTAISTDRWFYEYSLNNSSFTAEQWATINSGLTSQIATDVNNINDLIPSAAGLNNQLADKLYVDTAISTATATFRGTFTNLATLQATEGDRNDYAFYSHQDTAGNTLYDRYKYVGRPDSRVPDGYTEMLRVTKPQNAQVYVNTGYKIKSTDRIYAKCYGYEYAAQEASVFGATDSNNKRFRLRKGYMTGGADLQSSSGSVGVGSLYNNQMIIEAYDGKVYASNIDGSNTQLKGNLTLENVDANLYLFVENGDLINDNLNFYVQWISLGDFIVYDSEGNKKLELVPCQNNQGVNGFYDTVSGTFKEPTGGSLSATAISSDNWLFEYSLNNSGFTSQQWATINSGLASHVTATGWDATKTQVLKNVQGTLTWIDET